MNYWIRYDPRALEDLKEILDYLVELNPNFPTRFRSALAETLTEPDAQPERWPPRVLPIRRAKLTLTRSLKYYVDYRWISEAKEIHVIQIIHQTANPRLWRS